MEQLPKIKLCGMMQAQDVLCADGLKADYIGFILSKGFKRTISPDTFYELEKLLCESTSKKVGVFVNEAIDTIIDCFEKKLDLIQLHGNEDEAYIKTLRRYTDKPLIKAFKITSPEDIQLAKASSADYILLDSGTGTGRMFNHSLIQDLNRPYFLAGGLTAENVSDVIKALHPYAVDASSSLETDGRKDIKKMRDFVNAVKEIPVQ